MLRLVIGSVSQFLVVARAQGTKICNEESSETRRKEKKRREGWDQS